MKHLLLAALLLSGVAQARDTPCSATTPNNALCVSWGPVATDTNGQAISGVTYRVERATGTTGTFATVATGLAATQYYAQSLSPNTYFFKVYAACTACTGESAASNTGTGAATPIPVIPSTPVIVIAATIREGQPPVYRIVQSFNLRSNEVVMVAPASMRPLFN